MKTDYTHIGILIDRSGSMYSIKDDMEGNLAEFLNKQKELPGICTVSIAQFDQQFEMLQSFVDIHELEKIRISPRGMTALYDALGKFIKRTGHSLSSIVEENRPSKVLIIVITDGQENASIDYTASEIKKMVELQEKIYSWDFVYLGSNQDALLEGEKFGNQRSKSLTYEANTRGINTAFEVLKAKTILYRSSNEKFSFDDSDKNY